MLKSHKRNLVDNAFGAPFALDERDANGFVTLDLGYVVPALHVVRSVRLPLPRPTTRRRPRVEPEARRSYGRAICVCVCVCVYSGDCDA